ncbi:Nostrin BM247 -like protein [Channa argus]|uniref:Osteoclast-stimulating factor 1 n=1 Tax=Channa argus TaxID=215402 RepID=A0A6G1PY32_CHAAH|nr:Nostrin BM247 -like protein [Channa argus]
MKDPISTCSYNQLYQNLKQFSKTGEYFCKELMTVFQQRAELELTYSKGLQKLAGKLIRVSKVMPNKSLGTAFLQEATVEIRQVLDEHNKRKRPLDSVIERTGKLVTANWSEQLKMVNRLTKSAEMQVRVDEDYFNINMEGHQMRLKWENTLKNCYQIIQELEKQRIEVLCNILKRYSLHMASCGHTLKHGQRQIDQLVQRVDMDKDIQTMEEENRIPADDNKVEFLMTDYFTTLKLDLLEATHHKLSLSLSGLEGTSKSFHRFSDSILKWKDKDCEHSVVQLTRPVKLRRAPFRSRQSLRSSIIYKGPAQFVTQQSVEPSLSATGQVTSTASAHEAKAVDCGGSDNGAFPRTGNGEMQGQTTELNSVGKCKALYNFTPKHDDELTLTEGDLLEIYTKEENGWWFGELNGQTGHFPSTYVEELPVLNSAQSSDA